MKAQLLKIAFFTVTFIISSLPLNAMYEQEESRINRARAPFMTQAKKEEPTTKQKLEKKIQHWENNLKKATSSKGKKATRSARIRHAANMIRELKAELEKSDQPNIRFKVSKGKVICLIRNAASKSPKIFSFDILKSEGIKNDGIRFQSQHGEFFWLRYFETSDTDTSPLKLPLYK